MAGLNIDVAGLGQAVGAVGGLAKDLRAAITGQAVLDPTAQAQLNQHLADLDAQVAAAQAAIDQAEAAKGGFAGNWRPMVGWICAGGLGYQYLLAPLGTWALSLFGVAIAAPRLDLSELMPLLLGLLGMAGLRSYDKSKGTAR